MLSKTVKKLLLKINVLMTYNPKLDIVVTCDSSSYGVGRVLAHQLPDGTKCPITFASRTLRKCEIKYSQIEKEALALLFAVKKFHNFLYGRNFTLVADHRPLIFLFGPTKAVPTLAVARVQRWALTLSAYSYSIRLKKGVKISNAASHTFHVTAAPTTTRGRRSKFFQHCQPTAGDS